MPHGFYRAGAIVMILAGLGATTPLRAADWPTDKLGEAANWDRAYNAETGTRFIPMQIILPGKWNGERTIDLPATSFIDSDGDRWKGPVEDTDAFTGAALQSYERSRFNKREGHTDQRFAVRAEQDGLGRVYDSRFGEIRCSGEIKFPLGEWQQGEVRHNEFVCKAGRSEPKKRRNTITIEKIDFPCRGVQHCLQFTWLHETEGQKEATDHRRFLFAPGLGEIGHDRLK